MEQKRKPGASKKKLKAETKEHKRKPGARKKKKKLKARTQ